MDFSQFEREVLLPPFPEASAALGRLFPAMLARRDRLKAAMDAAARGDATPLEPAKEILEIGASTAKALGLAGDDLWAWEPRDLGEPEKLELAGQKVTSATVGFS